MFFMKKMNNIKDLIDKVKVLKDQENYKEALEILEDLYEKNPDSEEIKKILIETLFSYGGYLNDIYTLKYEKAKESFKRIIEIDPNNYRAYYNTGIACFNLDKMEEAEKYYEKALEIKPDYKHCLYNLGLLHETNGDLQEALKYYERALRIDPKFTYALHARNEVRNKLDSLK